MSDHDALIAAICLQPDDDTPRLAFADYLEENGEPDRAGFIRAQIELARTPPWEPFAVALRWRRPDWVLGQPFRATLPSVDGFHVDWPMDAFVRGLGGRLNVRSLVAWKRTESRVLRQAPVAELSLWGSDTLDQWRVFAVSAVVPALRRVHLMASPVEPLRVLRETPAALGITDIHFHRASGAGMPFVIEELCELPLGKVIRGLYLRMGYESLDDLIDSLQLKRNLDRLALTTMGLTAEIVERLMAGPVVQTLIELDLRGNPLGSVGVARVARRLPPLAQALSLAATGAGSRGVAALAEATNQLRKLDLSGNFLPPRATRALARSPNLDQLRSLSLGQCGIGYRHLRHLVEAHFWPNLVELDLRDNPLFPAAVQQLLKAEVPDQLAALVLDGEPLGAGARGRLREKYGERVVFT